MRLLCYFSVCAFLAIAASGQATVEHAAASAGASGAAAGASGAGKAIGGVFRSLSETLDKAGVAANGNATTVTAATPAAKPSSKPATTSKPIDLSQVTEGLERAELVKRLGEPAVRLSEKSGAQVVERLWYNPGTEDQVAIRLIDGKVASVIPLASKKQEQEPRSRSDVAVTR